MIQTVIFDMDGVIINSEPLHFKIEKHMFEELKITVSFQEHCSYVGTSSQNMWEMIVRKHGVPDHIEELIKKEHSLYIEYLLHENNLHPIEGVTELIKELYKNNFKIVIASSSYLEVIDIVLARFKLSAYFMAKVSGTELVDSKPHPEIFLRSAMLADSKPEECLVIEDSENGITAAKAAGMKCIGFLNPDSGAQNLSRADLVIKCFKELNADFIKKF